MGKMKIGVKMLQELLQKLNKNVFKISTIAAATWRNVRKLLRIQFLFSSHIPAASPVGGIVN